MTGRGAPRPPWRDYALSSKAVVVTAVTLAVIYAACAVANSWPHPLTALIAGALIANGAWTWRYPNVKTPRRDANASIRATQEDEQP